jgi:acyl dehydratase
MTVHVGTTIPEWRVEVDPQAMKPFALLLRDPNPIHLDPQVVMELGLGDRVINQGPLNAGYVWEAVRRWLGDDALVTTLDLRFTSNAFAGESLTVGGQVDEVDESSGELRCSVWLRRDDGSDVLSGRATIAGRRV